MSGVGDEKGEKDGKRRRYWRGGSNSGQKSKQKVDQEKLRPDEVNQVEKENKDNKLCVGYKGKPTVSNRGGVGGRKGKTKQEKKEPPNQKKQEKKSEDEANYFDLPNLQFNSDGSQIISSVLKGNNELSRGTRHRGSASSRGRGSHDGSGNSRGRGSHDGSGNSRGRGRSFGGRGAGSGSLGGGRGAGRGRGGGHGAGRGRSGGHTTVQPGAGRTQSDRIRTPYAKREIGYRKLLQWNEIQNLDDLTAQVFGEKAQIEALLSKKELGTDIVLELCILFAKITMCSRRQMMLSVLSLLSDSLFILKHLPLQLEILMKGERDEKKSAMAEFVIVIITQYFLCFPTSFSQMPLDKVKALVLTIDDNADLMEKVAGLFEQKEELLRSTMKKDLKKNILDIKPPDDFRKLSTFPTINDIHCTEKPFLRPLIKVGSYNDEDHYLDVQFRLLKEDLVSPLRDGIREIMNDTQKKDQKISLKGYYGVRLLHAICTKNGFTYKLQFDNTSTKDIPWAHSKRLIFGSLLCLSTDKFQTMIFATVADRKPEELKKGLLDVRFEDPLLAKEYCRSAMTMHMVECPSYFEAYRHVLDGMKTIQEVPFSQYLVDCNNTSKLPQYLLNKGNVMYDLSRIHQKKQEEESGVNKTQAVTTSICKKERWPDASKTNLNESQLKAFMHAITNEFCVIQGPPGTGKTHVGLHIADALLENKKYWNSGQEQPMLVVCYTNHALDQFLKGLIEFGHNNIIRVGGRASEELSAYNLRNKSREISGHKNAKWTAYANRDQIFEEVTPWVEALENLHRNVRSGRLLDYHLLINVMSSQHFEYLNTWDWKCKQLKISIFDLFLGLLNIDPENLANMYAAQPTIKNGLPDVQSREQFDDGDTINDEERIDIEGEGEVLTERWAVDDKVYQRENKPATRNHHDVDDNMILVDSDGFQTVQPTRKQRRRKIKEHLKNDDTMTDEEVSDVQNPWLLNLRDRWRLYHYWVDKFVIQYNAAIEKYIEQYEDACETLRELHEQDEEAALRCADVIAMTTTCAAKYRRCLANIKPKIVIIEEAAEVLEAHVLTSLSDGLEHLILIGDHKQLKPNPTVFELAKKYSLELSLFERMVNNGMQCHTLDIQHRMRPLIALLVRHIYPNLQNHSSVHDYPNVLGVQKNLLFINHNHRESEIAHLKSKSNIHEAEFMKALCRYFIKQGYRHDQITILTGYAGQLITLKNIMPRSEFDGIRVTAVDNFQGEENDIILLSLVRSNIEGNIGFLKTENRICVALSRAKVGLFVIGNINLLEKESPLWTKIAADMRATDSILDHLKLQCQNHPDTVVCVKEGKDFSCAPEGGCTRPCEYRLDCGHVCQMACHPVDPEHEEYVCKKKCLKDTGCGLGHECPARCHHGTDCKPCPILMNKVIPACNHTQRMKCSAEPEEFVCQAKCQRVRECGHKCRGICGEVFEDIPCEEFVDTVDESCGHTKRLRCGADISTIQCKVKCNAELECSHRCTGKCSRCKQGRLHIKCTHACERLLICSHPCKEPCISNCPPCKMKCTNSCVHSKCPKECGDVCRVCVEPCQWKCEHLKCTKKCYQQCNRERCNEPCKKILKCGHGCIGLCGEQCPKVCRVCHKDIVQKIFFGSEDEEDARFIVLTDCQHLFEVNGLDHWMEMDVEEGNVKLKECPMCKTPVRKSLRYGNIIKSVIADIDKIKEKIRIGNTEINKIKGVGYSECKKMHEDLMGRKESRNELERKFSKMKISEDGQNNIQFPQEKNFLQKTNIPKYMKSDHLWIRVAATLFHINNVTDCTRYVNQINCLKNLVKTKKKIKESKYQTILVSRNTKFAQLTKDLQTYLCLKLTERQFQQALVEYQRIVLFLNGCEVQYRLQERATLPLRTGKVELKEDRRIIDEHVKEFDKGNLLSLKKIATVEQYLNAITKKYSLDELTAAEKQEIIKAVGLGKGH